MDALKIRLLAGLTATLAFVAVPWPAQAQQLGIGRALFTTNCSRCHGLPPAVLMGAGGAAGEPALIAAAIGRVRPMAQFRDVITPQDMRDIAAFLATPDAPETRPADEVERLFNWAEWRFQTVLKPRVPTIRLQGYLVRYYAEAGLYVGMANGLVWAYDEAHPGLGIHSLGSMPMFLGLAAADGF